jgi:hypothetical protein
MMTPGLPHLLRIELEANHDGEVSEVVHFHTSAFDWMIPVRATVRPNAEKKAGEEEDRPGA